MFRELLTMLHQNERNKISIDTEILLGLNEKPKTIKKRFEKLLRKYGR